MLISVFSEPMKEKTRIEKVKEKYEAQLMSHNGVVGVGIGERPGGKLCIKVYVKEFLPEIVKEIPQKLEGFRVEIEQTGEIKPLKP